MSNKISVELMAEDYGVKSISMDELEASAKELPKVSPKLMAEDEAMASISMEELEALCR